MVLSKTFLNGDPVESRNAILTCSGGDERTASSGSSEMDGGSERDSNGFSRRTRVVRLRAETYKYYDDESN